MYNELKKRVIQAKSVDSPMLKAELLIGRKKLAPLKSYKGIAKRGKMLAGPMGTGMGAGMAKGMTKAVKPKPMPKTKPAKPGIPIKGMGKMEQAMDMGIQKGLKNFRNR